ncbi:hypothetical protein [Roseivivax marinus]|nr:hypothetical protein [Roseivivax marinus]
MKIDLAEIARGRAIVAAAALHTSRLARTARPVRRPALWRLVRRLFG